jgi:tetratricopeptide (TPR) repeat protein
MISFLRFFLSVASLVIVTLVAHPVFAMGGDPPPFQGKEVDSDYTDGEKAVKAKNWNAAVEALSRAATRDDKNADIYNYLGYAERNRGNLSVAFKHYERALTLNPKHRGAHEYVGEAYLLAGNVAKAEEHLAALDKLCFFPCAEYRELKEKIVAREQARK